MKLSVWSHLFFPEESTRFKSERATELGYLFIFYRPFPMTQLVDSFFSFLFYYLRGTQFGPWSEFFETKSGPGVPDVPSQPQLVSRSAHSIALSWAEPAINGSAIIDYRLEIAHNLRSSRSSSSVSSLVDTVESQSDLVDFEQLVFSLAHSGSARQHEVKGLHPSTNYFFRIQAVNAVGCSPSSSVASITTLASSPAAVSNLRCIAIDATSLSLSWSAPHSNGSPILYYNVEVGDRGTFCTNDPATSFDALDLTPNTQYRY